jgi:hypothetical protein
VVIPEDLVVNIAVSTRYEINRAFANLRQIALGRDIKKFLMVCPLCHLPMMYNGLYSNQATLASFFSLLENLGYCWALVAFCPWKLLQLIDLSLHW